MTSFPLALVRYVAFFIAAITSVSGLHTTKYEVGAGTRMKDYAYVAGCTGSGTQPSCAHKPSTNKWLGTVPILADLSGTGSATVTTQGPVGPSTELGTKYASACIPNPFRKMGTGTGTTYFNTGTGALRSLYYKNVKNPNAAGGDIGFVQNCESGTGQLIINDTCTATGCLMRFVPTASNGAWGGYDFIKFGLRKDPTPSFRGKIYLEAQGL